MGCDGDVQPLARVWNQFHNVGKNGISRSTEERCCSGSAAVAGTNHGISGTLLLVRMGIGVGFS